MQYGAVTRQFRFWTRIFSERLTVVSLLRRDYCVYFNSSCQQYYYFKNMFSSFLKFLRLLLGLIWTTKSNGRIMIVLLITERKYSLLVKETKLRSKKKDLIGIHSFYKIISSPRSNQVIYWAWATYPTFEKKLLGHTLSEPIR